MRIQPSTSLLCVIDIQERLLAAMPAGAGVTARAVRLATAARLLDVRAVVTEQYPRGLGSTPSELAAQLPPPIPKISFSCCGCEAFAAAVPADAAAAILCGLETHVCILQTALDLLAEGLTVFVAVDAVTSRHGIDHDIALRRLEASGALLTTTEAVLFEWCRTAENPRFQAIRQLVTSR